jgi:putative ABC transport system permease protein
MAGLGHDFRSSWRLFRHDWRFSLTLVITLGTGIAATATVFNVLNNTLLRPLPVVDEDRVFRLLDYTKGPDGQPVRRSTRAYNYLAIRDSATSFDHIAALRSVNVALEGTAAPVQVSVALISAGTFDLLNVRPAVGRLFTAEELAAGADASVVILSHALWRDHLGGRDDIVGVTLRLNGRPHTVAGVLGPGFRFPYEVDAWMPERLHAGVEASVATIARLRREISPAQAQQELDAIGAATERERPDTNRGLRFTMQPLREQLIGDQTRITWNLFAAAILLLALSCANVANLLLARGARRGREIAVQSALGASRLRQAQQFVVEALVYSAAGTTVGLACAALFGDLAMSLVPLPLRTQLGLGEVTFDWRAAIFAAGVTAVTAVAAGLFPARRLASVNPVEALRDRTRGSTGSRTLMQALVVGEVALAAVLLHASAVMTDNLTRLTQADLGLRADGLSTIEITVPEARYPGPSERNAIVRRLLDAAVSVPGVTNAGIVTVNPLERGSFGAAIETEDRPLAPREAGFIVNNRLVTPGWIATAGVPLLQGRLLTPQDDERNAPVVMVSHRTAERLWPGQNPIGKRIRQARPNAAWLTVVGVVADVRDFGDWRETWYLPYAQQASTFGAGTLHLMLRSPLPPDTLGAGMRAAIATVDAHLPVPFPAAMSSFWDASLEQQRLAAAASVMFGTSGLLLAVIGTYGLLAYAVSTRVREFGIRLALGARRIVVLNEILRQGATLAGAGLLLGAAGGLATNRALLAVATESRGIPLSLTLLGWAALAASALMASLVPALHATRIHPAEAMRTD